MCTFKVNGFLTYHFFLFCISSATDGCDWISNSDWLGDDDYCNWQGVTCTEDTNSQGFEVTEINLSNNNLVGFIPSSIGGLFNLERLDLSKNSLNGIIPTNLGLLASLEVLSLERNSYNNPANANTGVIPTEVCNNFNPSGSIIAITADCAYPYLVDCDTAGGCCNYCDNEAPSSIPSSTPSESAEPSEIPTGTPIIAPSMSPSCDSSAPSPFTCDGYNLRASCEALVDFYESTGGCSWARGYDGYVSVLGLSNDSTDGPEHPYSNDVRDLIQKSTSLGVVEPLEEVEPLSTGTLAWFSGTSSGGQQDPFCDWYGVTCENSGCTVGCDVVKIELWNNNLRGTLTSLLSRLFNLESLELGSNNIRGTIPDAYGLLPNLKVLILDNNDLTGTYNDATSSAICGLIDNGQLEQFWTDCDDNYEVECDCCTSCGSILAPSESPSVSAIPSALPSMAPSDSPSFIPSDAPSFVPSDPP